MNEGEIVIEDSEGEKELAELIEDAADEARVFVFDDPLAIAEQGVGIEHGEGAEGGKVGEEGVALPEEEGADGTV